MDSVPIMQIKELEKQGEDTMIFPAFSLEISAGQSVAICSNMNVRRTLLGMLSGKIAISGGEIIVKQERLLPKKLSYHHDIGILFMDDKCYERLNINDHF
jgi:ABC-2 type transport system ATP-binding protein